MDPEKLNDDQKRALKTLSALEAVQKELGEVKKAVEARYLFVLFLQIPICCFGNRLTRQN
jgi:hypothetical protein